MPFSLEPYLQAFLAVAVTWPFLVYMVGRKLVDYHLSRKWHYTKTFVATKQEGA